MITHGETKYLSEYSVQGVDGRQILKVSGTGNVLLLNPTAGVVLDVLEKQLQTEDFSISALAEKVAKRFPGETVPQAEVHSDVTQVLSVLGNCGVLKTMALEKFGEEIKMKNEQMRGGTENGVA